MRERMNAEWRNEECRNGEDKEDKKEVRGNGQ